MFFGSFLAVRLDKYNIRCQYDLLFILATYKNTKRFLIIQIMMKKNFWVLAHYVSRIWQVIKVGYVTAYEI